MPQGGLNPDPPTNTYSNNSLSNCGSGSLCTPQTLATGIPAIWETPFVTAVNKWWLDLIAWAGTSSIASQIGYIRFGFSIGSEATINCTSEFESIFGPGNQDSAIKGASIGAYSNAASYISGQRTAQSPLPTWVPMMTVNMGQSLATSPGTDPSWSIAEAQIILSNQPFAIGSQGLENGKVSGTIVSDVLDIPNGPTCTGSNCCSNNWCNTRPMVIGQVPFIELQDCNISSPAGGGTNCLNSGVLGANTAPNSDATLSQVFILSSQHGTTSAEIYKEDLECAFASLCSGSTATAYSDAIMALAVGQPIGTGALIGDAKMIGSATIF